MNNDKGRDVVCCILPASAVPEHELGSNPFKLPGKVGEGEKTPAR